MTRIPETLASLAVPVDDLVPYQGNPRRGDLDLIAASLSANGQYRPIVVRRGTNQVLAGNHTLAAAKSLGWDRIAATFIECSDEEAARIVLVDNRANDKGAYDDAALLDLLEGIEGEGIGGLLGTGYEDDDLANLRAILDADAWGDGPQVHHAGEHIDGTAALMPRIELRVPVDVFEAWLSMLNTQDGKDDATKLERYLTGAGFLDPEPQ